MGTVVRVVPVLLVAFGIRPVLELGDDFTGFLATLLLITVVAAIWGLVLDLARRGTRQDVDPPRRDE